MLQVLVEDLYSRILDRLASLPVFLLSASTLGLDFHHHWMGGSLNPGVGGTSAYILPDGSDFEPVLVGTVASLDYGGPDRLTVVLRLPPHPTPEMEAFFKTQAECLSSTVQARCDLTPLVLCEDVIPWVYGDTLETTRIHLSTSPDTVFERENPGRCFFRPRRRLVELFFVLVSFELLFLDDFLYR
ncbi:hypothetical protein C8F04DRAFT_1255135 [Mycena alexandri]|uniref:Uncharacterized protein n=1 Tax=Mycena alexandri TaxID=1745969 RepID=A0AAD6T5X0_9AGAR|nr:hypothetical protein C8F04DRAFT_1255135 [Mycena alexandri]